VEALADRLAFCSRIKGKGCVLSERGREFVSRQFSVAALVQRHEVSISVRFPGVARSPIGALVRRLKQPTRARHRCVEHGPERKGRRMYLGRARDVHNGMFVIHMAAP